MYGKQIIEREDEPNRKATTAELLVQKKGSDPFFDPFFTLNYKPEKCVNFVKFL
jgi:hypothetical protein